MKEVMLCKIIIGIETDFDRDTEDSIIPVLRYNSTFFKSYNKESYKVISNSFIANVKRINKIIYLIACS